MEYRLSESDNIDISKNEKIFLNNIEFSPKTIIIDKDTINFQYGMKKKEN
jgi:hypothetical protein